MNETQNKVLRWMVAQNSGLSVRHVHRRFQRLFVKAAAAEDFLENLVVDGNLRRELVQNPSGGPSVTLYHFVEGAWPTKDFLPPIPGQKPRPITADELLEAVRKGVCDAVCRLLRKGQELPSAELFDQILEKANGKLTATED